MTTSEKMCIQPWCRGKMLKVEGGWLECDMCATTDKIDELNQEVDFKALFNKLAEIASEDMATQTASDFLVSCTEELGELAREVGIKYKPRINKHKKPDEGIRAESVDLVIAALAMFWYESVKLNRDQAPDFQSVYNLLLTTIDKKLDKWIRSQNSVS